jgi:hypothetical protein
LAVIKTVQDLFVSESAHFRPHLLGFCQSQDHWLVLPPAENRPV